MIEVPFVAEDSTDTLYTLSHGGMIDVLFVAEDSTDTILGPVVSSALSMIHCLKRLL